MHMNEYQRRAGRTDQNRKEGSGTDPKEPLRHDVIPLLGLVGEVGGLLGEYKKLLRDGHIHRRLRDEVAEELGDIMWYVANVAGKFDLTLDQVAAANLTKVEDRWLMAEGGGRLYDVGQKEGSRLPRRFRYSFDEHADPSGIVKVRLWDESNGAAPGDPLRDNAYEDDGYRFHDAMHLTLAALLGWSPVLRKLLRDAGRVGNRTPDPLDNAEDGGRAQVVEEAVVLMAYAYAVDNGFLEGAKDVDWQLLRTIRRLTMNLEVKDRTAAEWNAALLRGFEIWRQLRDHGGGTVEGDLFDRSVTFSPPPTKTG